jgi:hypothetical protein
MALVNIFLHLDLQMLLIILFRSISHEHKILTIIYSQLFREFLVNRGMFRFFFFLKRQNLLIL